MQPLLQPDISSRAADMPRSSIRRIFNAAKQLEAQGVPVIRLDIGDPDFTLPERIKTAVGAALERGETHYSPMPGIPALRTAISKHVTRRLQPILQRHQLSTHYAEELITAEQVVVSQGATQALNACMQLCCDRGTAIMLPSIYFPNYMQQVALAGINVQFYELDGSFQPVMQTFELSAVKDLRAILINTPSNPTGALFPPETLRRLYAFARENGLWLIVDEAYFDYVYEGDYLSPLALDLQYPAEERRVLAIYSFSKSYAATGLRMGYTVTPNEAVASQLGLLNEPLTGSLTTPLQWGMLAALEEDDVASRRDALLPRRLLAQRILHEHGFELQQPAGGLFYFIDISVTGMDADSFADALLKEKHVAVVPGSGFGLVPHQQVDGHTSYTPHELAQRCIRLCFATPESNVAEGIKRLAEFIAQHSR